MAVAASPKAIFLSIAGVSSVYMSGVTIGHLQ